MLSKVTTAIESVKNSPASIFTKEDVIKLLNETMNQPVYQTNEDDDDVEPTYTMNQTEFDDLKDEINEIINNFSPNVDPGHISDVTFQIDGGDRISIDEITIEVDTYDLQNDINDLLDKFIGNQLAK